MPLDMNVSGGAKCYRLDQVVIHVGVQTGLTKRVNCRAGRPAANEPSLQVGRRNIVKGAGFPDQVPVTADQMRAGVAIGLRR